MRIKELNILTFNLNSQIDFYKGILGLNIINRTENKVTFKIGNSLLTLKQDKNFKPYHIAINIPCNMDFDALKWLKERLNVLKFNNNEIQDFSYWNANAIYFYDADKNVMEFITRRNLNNQSTENFSYKSLLEISEIGMPVDDIKSTYESIRKIVNIPIYDGGFDKFCAIGGEKGLFICINKNKKRWFPTGDKAYSSDFEIDFQLNKDCYSLRFDNGKIYTNSK